MKTLVVVGNDKLGRKFIKNIEADKYKIILDNSSSIKRVLKLIQRGSLRISLVFKMFVSDLLRKNYVLDKEYDAISTNDEFLKILQEEEIEQVVLYRGGLIINRKVLDLKVKILNIHCARIPEYGGIGVLDRALRDKAYNQEATLHIITERIDKGEVLEVEPYELNSSISYVQNENIAYDSGTRLFNRFFT